MEPPSTPEEIRAAALQFVRKVSGVSGTSSRSSEAAFSVAVDEITATTTRLLAALDAVPTRAPARTREGERDKARARWEKRARTVK